MASFSYYIRFTIYSVTLLAVSFIAVFIGLVATLLGNRLNTNHYVALTFYHICGPLIGWKFDVEGEEYLWELEGDLIGRPSEEQAVAPQIRSAVLLCNHQSFVDILYLGRIFPKHAAIMAKKELKWIPGLGWFMALSGSVFINRSNNKSAVAAMTQAGDDMKRRKISLLIFPEGTRHNSPEPDLLPFKKGAFYLAVQAGAPIIPVVCQNYHHLFDGKTRFKSGTLRLRILPPIPTTNLTVADVPALVLKTRETMLEALRDLSLTLTPTPSEESNDALLPSEPRRSIAGYQSISQDAPVKAAHQDEVDVEEAVGGGTSLTGEGPKINLATSEVVAGDDQHSELNGAGGDNSEVEEVQKVEVEGEGKKHSIAMVSDFFLPVVGGVEGHIYSLGVELMRRGHKVIVITHHHPPRTGIRYLAPTGLKVYHLPISPIASSATLPNFLLFLPYLRTILRRERIDIVHGHGSLSSLAHEAILQAPLFGIKTVFTDHSLFGFTDAVGILTNKLLRGALRNVDAVICVSHTGRENTVLRAGLKPDLVYVIPNAVVAEQFRPGGKDCTGTSRNETETGTETDDDCLGLRQAPKRARCETIEAEDPDFGPDRIITIVVISRLVYRKGIDLLLASAPTICALHPQVKFVIAGSGPKMTELLQMRERYLLQDRIRLLGSVQPDQVRDVLSQGEIYLNTSLTEAFGISIIEAAAAGLFVVSTRVGGVPEILPEDMIEFARADEDDITRALTKAIETVRLNQHQSPFKAHSRVQDMYSWSDVARRTETVYDSVLSQPDRSTFDRLSRLIGKTDDNDEGLGPVFGIIMCCIVAVQHIFLEVLDWIWPVRLADGVVPDWDYELFKRIVEGERLAYENRKSAA